MKKQIAIAMLLVTTSVAACSQGGSDRGARVDRDAQRVDLGLSRLGTENRVRAGGAQFSDGIFVGSVAERSAAALLPSRVQKSGSVNLVSRDPLTLPEIAQRLTEATGIPHVAALGPRGTVAQAGAAAATAGDIASGIVPGSNAQAAGAAAAQQVAQALADQPQESEQTMIPRLRGSLSEVLDQVANAFELEWTFADGRVIMRDFVTRKYQVSALPTVSSHGTSMDANGMSSSSQTSANVWQEVEQTIGSMVGDGSTIVSGTTTGIVTVTAKVSDHDRVAEYIKQLNGNIAQQVSFDVNVLTVTFEGSDALGLDLASAFGSGAEWSGGASGSSALASETGSVNIGLLRGDVNISAVMNALSSQGRVSVSTRAGATTSNNRVAPISVTDTTAYVAGYETETNGDEDILRAQVEQLETGFQMHIFPRILNNRELMVQYSVRLSELQALKSVGEGAALVQLPEVSTTSFEQQAVLENGQTLVLAGFERTRAETSQDVRVVGGNKRSASSRVATVMLITPRILGRAR